MNREDKDCDGSNCYPKLFHRICPGKLCPDELMFKLLGVTPHKKEFRDVIDWLYLALLITTLGYKFSIWICFFFYPNPVLFALLDVAFDAYMLAVTGYATFNVAHRYHSNNRRHQNVDIAEMDERRKERNGHKFIRYWWLNFLMMYLATFFGWPGDLSEGPMKLSLKIAVICSAIGLGYWLAKKKWNGLSTRDNTNPVLWLLGFEKKKSSKNQKSASS